MKREDQKLSAGFVKNIQFEKVLSSLNESLFKEQEQFFQDNGDMFPTLHVLGAPRSGTTLATQLLLSYLPVGYINNLASAFWKAPVYGIELSKKLVGLSYVSNFKSTYGRTDHIREPHEFGYFWNYHLAYPSLQQQGQEHEENINWPELTKVINNMTYSFERPIIFKSFLYGFHAVRAQKEMPKTCFVYIKRNFLDNAFSILKLRNELNGDVNAWGSIKPKQYPVLKDLNVYEQIAGQILCMEHEYLQQLEQLPAQNKLVINYETICADPAGFLRQINDMFKFHDAAFSAEIADIDPFEAKLALNDNEEANRFIEAKSTIENLFPYLKTL